MHRSTIFHYRNATELNRNKDFEKKNYVKQ